jgi:kinetochore protein NDC80
MNRRMTLGGISQSGANSRASRQSLGPSGPSRVSHDDVMKPMHAGRQSLAPGAMPLPSAAMTQMATMASAIAGGDRRGSIGPGRKSSLGVARKSSIVGRGSTIVGRVADPRNMNDRAFMNNSIRQLIDYLTQHSFDHAISTKILSKPAVKDFNNIVHFLFKQIDPNFACTGQFGEETIAMFKHLRYPFSISKMNLVAVGSPTAWPALLAAIMWLVELLNYDEEAVSGIANQEAELDDPSTSAKAFFSYLDNAYGCFLGGDDEAYAELEGQFVSSFETTNEVIAAQIATLAETNRVLATELAEIDNRRAYLPGLRARKKDYQSDHAKFEQLVQQLIKHREQLETKKSSRHVELTKLEANIAAVKGDIDGLKQRVASQELSPDDVRRMTEKKEKLHDQLETASEAKSTLERKTWESEMALREKVIALEESSRSYNSLAEELKLVPHSARNARGKQLAIDIDTRAKKRSALLKTNIRDDVLPVLEDLRGELSETVQSMKSELVELQDKCEEVEQSIAEADEAKAAIEAKSRRAEEAFKREREALDSACQASEREMDEMESRLAALRDCSTEEARHAAATRRSAEARAARDSRRLEHKATKREMLEGIMDVVTQCANHRELVQSRLEELRNGFSQRLDGLLLGEGTIGSSSTATAAPTAAQSVHKLNSSRINNRFSSLARPSMAGRGEEATGNLAGLMTSVAVEDVELLDESASHLV